jgi:hypothetical protein
LPVFSVFSNSFTNVLLNNGIKISMDGKGRAIDNILLKDYVETNTRTSTDGISLYREF